MTAEEGGCPRRSREAILKKFPNWSRSARLSLETDYVCSHIVTARSLIEGNREKGHLIIYDRQLLK